GKLTARERIDLLVDPGSFTELGIHAGPHFSQRAMDGREAPADGVITGWGSIEGRPCAIAAYDFTVMAGAMGMSGELKVSRLREMALGKRMPLIWLLDSAGARIQEAAGSLFAGSGHLFQEEVVMSGVVPMVAAMMGPCAAGTAYIPALADFVPMVSGQGAMALAGPHLTKAVTGEDISMEELGGAKVHCRKSGVGDLEVADDRECIAAVRRYLSFFPSNCDQSPPFVESSDPADRMSERLLDIVPASPRKPYDMYEVIGEIVDDGEWFDLKPKFARTIITCLARIGGRAVGIVANQPKHLGGILENDSADKAARFVNLCDAFNIPLVFLQDVPGFMVGSKVEHAGIIRHGAKMLYAVSRATVPKITVIVRKAYGAGYYVMNGRAYEPDLLVAWPSAEISVMGAEGAVNIIGRSAIEASDDPEATREAMLEEVRKIIDPYIAARNALIDDVIDPRETRPMIVRGLEMSASKQVERPRKKHGVMPV
nr:acyl-CoA carboxylase subunit beta [Solirubrobacterales bacterium]